ncbi:serine hydrolase [Fulvivirgaceae bacterium BMA12]|uniref:Serine hydrolase n=1 Tax=Agaribacillus aureus TaxID=3051825 RepID=A0ABT8L6C8_9BACT|nr:serine hydrolase [Fulvivirgaceae bacterium BMA12]
MYPSSLFSQTFHKILCPALLINLCLLLLAGQSAFANNGAIAYAYPVKGISIDGRLSDWPQDLVLYPIQRIELGDPFSDQKDLEAYFRVGYNLAQKAIYLAVEVIDQSAVYDTTSQATWNSQDGIELYLDAAHVKSGSAVIQYSQHGDKRLVSGPGGSWDPIEMVMLKTDFGRVYEWRINLEQAIEPGKSLGMDVVVMDKDEDKTFSWVAWGKHVHKMNNPDRCGDLVLLDAGTALAELSGQVDFSNLTTNITSGKLRLNAIDNPKMWLQTAIDSLGYYSATVPVGSYHLEVPGTLIRKDDKYYRVAPGEPITFTVNANQANTPPLLTPREIPRPDLLPAKGLLHNFDKDRETALNHFVDTYREYYGIPGVSLALIKDGKVIYHQTYGVKNVMTNEPVDENTLFEAASVTKPVFAFVVLRLAEKGIIDLDKPLFEYLPFDALETYPEYKKMTARHVLTHRSGLPNWGVELKNTPGTKYGYSGEGFEYLKRVVVHIMQEDIEHIIDEELINLLGLYHMEFSDNEELRKVVSSGHIDNRPTAWPIPEHAGMAYSLHTESKAFSAFAIALLERKGLQSDTHLKLMEIHTEIPAEYWKEKNNREGFGLGIFIRESDYGNTFSHGGNNGDFKCLFEVYQDLKMGYVIFTNSDMGDVLAGDMANLLVEGAIPQE